MYPKEASSMYCAGMQYNKIVMGHWLAEYHSISELLPCFLAFKPFKDDLCQRSGC
jgi:hypothetical protein